MCGAPVLNCVRTKTACAACTNQMELLQTTATVCVGDLRVAPERRRIAEATKLQKETFEHMREANQISSKQVAPATEQ